MKRLFAIAIITLFPALIFSQTEKVKWYTIEEAAELTKTDPRPIFVDVYTDWCSWCKVFDRETFPNPVIAEILNTKYYAVKFNAESKDPVVFQDRTFINDGKMGRLHQLAYALLQGQASFPTVAFLTAKTELITPIPGYKDAKQFEPLLMYFAGTDWQKISYADFMKSFESSIK